MSDGNDPRHGPYRGTHRPAIDLDEWCHELTYELIKKGFVVDDAPVVKMRDEIKDFAVQVVRATRDGHFKDIPQKGLAKKETG